jgi:hypothetical protein
VAALQSSQNARNLLSLIGVLVGLRLARGAIQGFEATCRGFWVLACRLRMQE